MQLDQAFIKRMQQPMWQTWNSIGYDIIACMQECGEELTNEQAIESCCDANNLWLNGNDKEADQLMFEMCRKHGYVEVQEFLCKHFKFA